jgi:hypothetical protein
VELTVGRLYPNLRAISEGRVSRENPREPCKSSGFRYISIRY